MTRRLSPRGLSSVRFRDAARTGALVPEMPRSKPATPEVATPAAKIELIAQ
jgi:hypothetical protein